MNSFFTSLPGFSGATPLAQSGSHRAYYRIQCGRGSVIGVENDNIAENKTFIAMAKHFKAAGINVPEVYEISGDGRCYTQEDLGDDMLRNHLDDDNLLKEALRELVKMQQAGRDFDFSQCFATKEFGPRIIDFDLNYFKYCFLKPMGIEFDEIALQDDLDKMKEDLCKENGDGFLYRDFQSRNIMVKDGKPYFIDFQGGFRGPFYYDLCSFVFQASAGFSNEKRSELIDFYHECLSSYVHVDRDHFDRSVRLFALLRCLQTLGCYGFRGLTEGKQYFIDSIPAGLRNFKELADERYPYLKYLAHEFDNKRI